MRFDILTIFPGLFESFLNESIIAKAIKAGKIEIEVQNFRKYARGKHKQVDDRPYGGGPGMLLKVEPIYYCLKALKKKKKRKIILLSPQGRTFNQRMARNFSKLQQLILICGRYEGFDERVKKFVDLTLSVGDYITMGGEVPAMIIIEAVTRLIPGVLGEKDSIKEESFSKAKNYLEYPQYTRPPIFKGLKVPRILLSGDHKKIAFWREKKTKLK